MALRVHVSGLRMASKAPSSSSSAIIGGSSSLVGSEAASLKVGGIRVAHPSTTRCSIIQMNCFPNAKLNANALNISFEDQATEQLKMLEKAVTQMIDDLLIMCQVTASFIVRQRMWESTYKSVEQDSKNWYKELHLALITGDDARADKLLEQHKYYADLAAKLKNKVDNLQGEVANSVNKIRLIEINIEATASQMDTIKALKQSSKTNKTVNELSKTVKVTRTLEAFIRLEKRAMSRGLKRNNFDQLIADESKGKISMSNNLSLGDASESLKGELSEGTKFSVSKGQSFRENSRMKELFEKIQNLELSSQLSFLESFSVGDFTSLSNGLYRSIKFLMSKGLWLDDSLESLEN